VTAPARGGGRRVLRGARFGGDVAITDGVVSAVGDVPPEAGDRVLDCDGEIITPGLVNAHHHLYQWLTRGRALGCNLFGWLDELYPVWSRISAEDVAAAARRGIAELALSGVTSVFDHHYVVPSGDDAVFDAVASAAAEIGLRLFLARGSMDLGQSKGGLPPDSLVEQPEEILRSTVELAARLHDGDMVSVVVAPCSPFSVSPGLMVESAALARSRGLRLHTHLAESQEEESDCLARFGRRPLEYVEELGWLGPDVWFAHGVHFDDNEVARLAASGTGVAHCPSSNARLAAGSCPVRDLLDAGAPVGLGVDGAASNEGGRLFPEMRQALYTARLRRQRPEDMYPAEALRLATEGGAACLGRVDLGRIAVGLPADLAVWPASDLADVADPLAGLVLGPDRPVRHLLVGGEDVVRDSALTRLDIAKVRDEAVSRSRRLWS
jgi:cytosine/adenosine deaminase-related metal-dependent hydrolase